jgi:NAD(P)H-dependent flavin oxidoreductase YrpB (nitropropane dioxygenase family)
MGVGVSSWRLAQTVSRAGHLGVVSGVALDTVLSCRLQDGDQGGHIRRVLERFPVPGIVEPIMERYFLPGGRAPGQRYKRLSMHSHRDNEFSQNLCVVGTFVEVALAREGHDGLVGINLLTKIQTPTVPTLFGAMLAGVHVIVMGAGIPRDVPGSLDSLAVYDPVETGIETTGASGDRPAPTIRFDPTRFRAAGALSRPAFMPIVSSHMLATILLRKATGSIQGFVVEGPTAGGHNAPPRGTPVFDDEGQPVYGERDRPDLEVMRSLGVPFWLAGGIYSPERVREAMNEGAAGVQVGTLFAFCKESGMRPELRRQVLDLVREGKEHVRTDARASSTGYPFKVAEVPGTVSEASVHKARERVCDLGYLREVYLRPDDSIGYRCAAEPVETYLLKGGRLEDTVGRRCICNSLIATIGMGQLLKDGTTEPPIVTSGDALPAVLEVLGDREDYSAADVIAYLMGEPRDAVGAAASAGQSRED